jgi:uncharacterized metal-binding protein YceD (DUF177 family)
LTVTASPLVRRVNALKLTRDGARFNLAADQAQLLAIATALEIPAVLAFSANVEARAVGQGRYMVDGEVTARIRQTCVLSGEAFDSDVSTVIDAAFADDDRLTPPTKKEVERSLDDEDPPEPLDNGHIDIGALAIEFLALALEPFPRKPGAVYAETSESETEPGPFVALAAFKAGRSA